MESQTVMSRVSTPIKKSRKPQGLACSVDTSKDSAFYFGFKVHLERKPFNFTEEKKFPDAISGNIGTEYGPQFTDVKQLLVDQ